MKITQTQSTGIALRFILSLLILFRSAGSFSTHTSIKTQTDIMAFGPPPERYQEWSDLEELFDSAVVDETLGQEELHRTFEDGKIYGEQSAVDSIGILHLICLEKDLDLGRLPIPHVGGLITVNGPRLMGLLFQNANFKIPNNVHVCRECSLKDLQFEKLRQFFTRILTWYNCDFRRTKFNGRDVPNFDTCLLQKASFRDWPEYAGRPGGFLGCNLQAATFYGSEVGEEGLAFEQCNLRRATFRGTFARLYFDQCDLSDASFEGLEIDGFEFWGCLFEGANFRQTKILYTTFEYNVPSRANFAGAIIKNSSIEKCTLSLIGSRYFNPNSDPFPGAIMGNPIKLEACSDTSGHPIPDCTIYGTPPNFRTGHYSCPIPIKYLELEEKPELSASEYSTSEQQNTLERTSNTTPAKS